MKIIIDSQIPFIHDVFEPYAEVTYLPEAEIVRENIADADALIIQNQTDCNAQLLEGTSVKMISTTGIGMNHIDLSYCQEHGIFVQNASGSNAVAVMNYFFSALYGCAARRSIDLTGATIGIIGCGQVGSKIESTARQLGFKILINDPIREESEGPSQFCSLDHLLQNSDIVTIHTPLNDNTRKMCNEEFFSKMGFGAIFVNTSRGALVDEDALLEAIPKLGPVIIDTWNNEPDVNVQLVSSVDIATPHIAGYTYQGKLNSTRIVVRTTARYFGISELYEFFPKPDIEGMDSVRVVMTGLGQGQRASTFQYNYPIFTDDFIFRMDPTRFTEIRKEYRYRREFFIE